MSTILDVLDRHGFSARPTGKGSEFIIRCPICSKSKLYVNPEKRLWICYVCGDGGHMLKLFKLLQIDFHDEFKADYESLRKKAEQAHAQRTGEAPAVEEVHALPHEYKPLIPGQPMMYVAQQVYDYLLRRGMTAEQIVAWRIGYAAEGKYAGCVLIPVYDKDGGVVTFQGRRVLGNGPKNMNPMGGGGFMFNTEYAQGHAGLVIVEGPFDAISIHARLANVVRISSVALLRHSISEEQAAYVARIIKPKVTWVGLDPDVDEAYMHKVGGALRANGCPEVFVALFPKDPDELPTEELMRCLDEAQPARPTRKA